MKFSPIDSGNLSECAQLFHNVFNQSPWNENWSHEAVATRLEECLRTPRFYGLLAHMNDQPVGFALGYCEQWDEHQHFYLKEMCVAPDQQRSGVGTALMEALEARLKNHGVEKLYLYTARDSGAQHFYEKQGFYVSPRIVMMAKWLTTDQSGSETSA